MKGATSLSLKDAYVRDLLAENVGGRFEEHKLAIDNYWHGYRIPHPVQTNLRALPNELIVNVISDFVAAAGRPTPNFVANGAAVIMRSSCMRRTAPHSGTHSR
jgi:hypothetical protein